MNRTLVVIDVQNEYFTGKLPVTYPMNSLDNILKVINTASGQGIPVIVVQHTQPKVINTSDWINQLEVIDAEKDA